MSTEPSAKRPSTLADRARYAAWPLVSIAVIVAFALLRMGNLAIPVWPNEVCPTIYPPTPGCAGDTRLAPAALWCGITLLAAAATVTGALSGRFTKQLSWVGVAVTGAIALFGIRQVEFV